ncbi:hypothetical protein V8G54_036796 [Vigna mungo]|uniref:non-specific serine/threonine protein kinase n=1 Tax=Vigna mungo TaxID=3915 RepID=A0AAQ3MHL8_VIGMU
MVSSQFSVLNENSSPKSFLNQLVLPNAPDPLLSSNSEDFEFSDVFGASPVGASITASSEKHGDSTSTRDSGGKICNGSDCINIRSQSLFAPTTCIGQSLQLSKLNIHETEDALDLVEVLTEAQKELEHSVNNAAVEKNNLHFTDYCLNNQIIGVEDFELLKVVGQGAFGKVYQVRRAGTSEIYAMKVMRKDKIIERNHAEYVKSERDILTKVDNPFVVRLRYAFQTKYRLYLVLDFVNGGHLFFQLYHQGLFREDLARFYAAEIICAVSYLHANDVMHRDLKPENILLDADGHAVLTDFGLAKQFNGTERSNSMCGTVEYMAPEIVMGKGHDKAADWWSVGILLYEMLTGKVRILAGINPETTKTNPDLTRVQTVELQQLLSVFGKVFNEPRDLPPVRNTIQWIMLTLDGYYQAFSRAFMRVNGTTQAPFMHFAAETSLGVVTIRALNMVNRFFNNYLKLVDMDAAVFSHVNVPMEWSILRIQILHNFTVFTVAALLILLPRGFVSSGLVGLSLSYALTSKESQVFWSRMYSMMSDHIISADKIKQFIHISTLFKGSI